jgi:methylenetetrahydrofolate reductase (NADPH)
MKVSYEFYPPKDLDYKKVVDEFSLINSHKKPSFISITYGAMGSSQEKSIGLIKSFKEKTQIDIAAHLTLVGKSKSDVIKIIAEFKSLGIDKIVALRGDTLEGKFQAHPDGFYNTSDFVKFLTESNLEVFVSAYPEPHPDSESFDFDFKLLKEKTLAGSNQCISQFCFSMKDYKKLINQISKSKINNELTAGIMPIYNINSLCNMAKRCGIQVPIEILEQFSDDEAQNEQAAINICINQIKDLQNMGVNNFHFYTLNQSSLLLKIFGELSLTN